MAILLHGTTRQRAQRIMEIGPDPDFREPDANRKISGCARAESFSTCLESGPFRFGHPREYALGKAAQFPYEGGPAILKVDVPDEVIAQAVDNVWFPLSQGLVQFDPGRGLEELRAMWSELPKEIVPVERS